MIGAKETVTFKCTNYGGAGRFRLLPEDQWPHPSGDAADASQPMRLAPFLIEPAEFELLGGETVEIQGKNLIRSFFFYLLSFFNPDTTIFVLFLVPF